LPDLTHKHSLIYAGRPVEAADVFRAIADPTRRALLDLLAGEEQPVSALVERFAMTQPAISQHLRVLREAGLVRERKSGRQRLYRLQAEALRDAYDWLGHYERFWQEKLAALAEHLRRTEAAESKKKPRSRRF
jgi:DNA-binding transcriptional ArsR family regulator